MVSTEGTAQLPTKCLFDSKKSSKIKIKKGLPLETKNTQNHENQRLGLIKSLLMQYCSLRGCIRSH